VYTPSGLGYFPLIAHVAHEGTTLRFPRPRYPFCHNIYWRYAAYRIPSLEKSDRSTKISERPTIATCSDSRDMTKLSNVGEVVTQGRCLQHLFSLAVGMIRHLPHLHHDGVALLCGGDGLPSGGLLSMVFADSIPPTWLKVSNINFWHCSVESVLTYSYKTNFINCLSVTV